MKILPAPSGANMVASGIVFARVVLPKGIEVGLNVTEVLPDVLVYDGPVPDDAEISRNYHLTSGSNWDWNWDQYAQETNGDIEVPPAPPLPSPLPERAFAHIRPEDWLNATCVRLTPDADEGTTVEVQAQLVEVPLEVLPGRDREFRDFVGKVRSKSFFHLSLSLVR